MFWILLLAPLVLQLAILYFLAGLLNKVTYRRLGKGIYLLLMWPGVVVHELSHLIGCLLTGTRVREVKLFAPHEESPGYLVLGYVSHDRPRNGLVQLIVSAAPFFGGAAALWLLLRLMVPEALTLQLPPGIFREATLAAAFSAVGTVVSLYAKFAAVLFASLAWDAWTTYVFLYFLFSIAAHIAPSGHDMRYAVIGALAVGILLAVLVWLGGRYAPAMAAGLAAGAVRVVGALVALLGYGVAVVVVVSAAVMGLAFITGGVRGRR